MTRAVRLGYWLAPVAFCITLYWLGLRTWFQQDDFVWLNLRNSVADLPSFLRAMIAPMAQGTFRSFSDRGLFLGFSYLFGLRASPYRLFVLFNQILNVLLVMLVTRRLTKSDLAGFLAPLLWLSNIALIIPMSWTSAYNQIQYPTFLLLSFYLFIRYTETGQAKFYWMQWATFLLGFGSLELNLVYPVIAALFALLFARPYVRSTVPMLGASVFFLAIVRSLSRQMGNSYYDMDFHPASLMSTFGQHWNILLGTSAHGEVAHWPDWLILLIVTVLTAAIVIFTAWQTRQGRFLPLFCLGWFLIVLAPLLPLHNHVVQYYPAIPAIGMAILAAHALSRAWERGWPSTALAVALALLYIVPSTSVVHAGMKFYYDRSVRVRSLVQNVTYAKQAHPGKTILIQNVDDDLFWSGVYYLPFRLFGWNDILLTPDSRTLVKPDPAFPPLDSYFLSPAATAAFLQDGSALVYAVEGRTLRDVTSSYTASYFNDPGSPPSFAANRP